MRVRVGDILVNIPSVVGIYLFLIVQVFNVCA